MTRQGLQNYVTAYGIFCSVRCNFMRHWETGLLSTSDR